MQNQCAIRKQNCFPKTIVACLQFVFALSIIYQFAVIGVWQIKCLNMYTVVSKVVILHGVLLKREL